MPQQPRRKAARVADGQFVVVIREFKASPRFQGLAQGTQDLWGMYLDLAARPDMLGALSIRDVRPSVVQGLVDKLAGKPGAQLAVVTALRQLEKWALVREKLPQHITTGIEFERPQGGHIPWSVGHITAALAAVPPQLVRPIIMAAGTGQRGSDIVKMLWSDLETYKGRLGINVVTKKTGRELWVPFDDDLIATVASWKEEVGRICVREGGEPWSRVGLTHAWMHVRDTHPDLGEHRRLHLVMHGLRAHACVRLDRLGFNTRQIANIVGMSEPMVARYCRLSLQKENASAAMATILPIGERAKNA
jgi:integrase